jgi:hypothetical protein
MGLVLAMPGAAGIFAVDREFARAAWLVMIRQWPRAGSGTRQQEPRHC